MTELREVCRVIYGVILTVITRRRFLRIKLQIVQVQKMVKVREMPCDLMYVCTYVCMFSHV